MSAERLVNETQRSGQKKCVKVSEDVGLALKNGSTHEGHDRYDVKKKGGRYRFADIRLQLPSATARIVKGEGCWELPTAYQGFWYQNHNS